MLILCFGHGHSLLDGVFVFFFFKQKTAYEMRISDWSSDVCSSDLGVSGISGTPFRIRLVRKHNMVDFFFYMTQYTSLYDGVILDYYVPVEIGRASCRERVCQYV